MYGAAINLNFSHVSTERIFGARPLSTQSFRQLECVGWGGLYDLQNEVNACDQTVRFGGVCEAGGRKEPQPQTLMEMHHMVRITRARCGASATLGSPKSPYSDIARLTRLLLRMKCTR